MRNRVLFAVVLALVLIVTACKQPAAPAAPANNAAAQPPAQKPPDPNATVPPRLLKGVHAEFPQKLWDKAGVVSVALLINPEGKVADAKVVNSPHPELNQLALDAVKQWQFDPARKAGKPVPVTVTVNVNFAPPNAQQPQGAPPAPAKK